MLGVDGHGVGVGVGDGGGRVLVVDLWYTWYMVCRLMNKKARPARTKARLSLK